jgi:hypothetical protein
MMASPWAITAAACPAVSLWCKQPSESRLFIGRTAEGASGDICGDCYRELQDDLGLALRLWSGFWTCGLKQFDFREPAEILNFACSKPQPAKSSCL